jgi:hypothetical protein
MRVSRSPASKVKSETPGPAALRVSFPDVRELRIELDFEPESGWEPSPQVHILHPPSRASFRYPCPFAGCSGWFDLEIPVTTVLREVTSGFSSHSCCTGVRPPDRSTGKQCGVRLNYRVQVTYADASARAP